jgi:Domain of unknown function (DUF1963)
VEREQRIREAVEDCIDHLVDTQGADDGSGGRGTARVVNALRDHGARLLQPAPQLFRALQIPKELSQSVTVVVPVPSTAGFDFAVSVRVTKRSVSWESWEPALLGAEPAGDGIAALRERTAALLEADRRLDLAGADWRLLLQVDSGEPLDFSFGDTGRIYFLMRGADLAARSWDRVRLVFQCH